MSCNNLNVKKCIRVVFSLPVLFILFLNPAIGQTWTGSQSSNWHDSGNWDTGKVPDANSTVTIRLHSSNPFPVITQNSTVKSINLPDWSSGELTVTNGATLTVTESFNINNNGKLILDGGILNFTGNGNGSNKINMGWTNTLIQIKNNGTLNSQHANLQLNGEIEVIKGTLNTGNGFQVSGGKLLKVTEGNINVVGPVNIFGTIDGGAGKFVFEGLSSQQLVIRNGGRFYMAPSSPSNQPPACDPATPEPPPLSGGSIDFYIPSFVESNGRIYGGDAVVTFYESTETQGDAGIEVHNGTIIFKGNSVVRNSGYMEITCKGAIQVEGNATYQNSGTLNAHDGNVTFIGNVTLANSGGTINAGSSTIHFSGTTFENSGTFNAGTSTFIFEGDGNQEIIGKNTAITFYNLIVEEGSSVQSEQNVLVQNDMTVDDNADFNVDAGLTLNVVGDVIGDPFVSTNRPYIVAIRLNALNSITAVFNEALNRSTATAISNYRIENQSGGALGISSGPVLGGALNNEVTLTLSFNMEEGAKYYLIVNNVQNLAGREVSLNHRKMFQLTDAFAQWLWTGATNNDWNNPANWDKNQLPAADSKVRIPVTANNPLVSTTGNRVARLKIEQGASLTIGSTGNLTVDENLENLAGTAGLVIASDAAGTGSLLHNTNSVPASFQRYISGEPQAWQMISSPVAAQSLSGDFTPAGGTGAYGDGTRYDFYTWYEPDTSWVYLLNDNQPPTWLTANGNNNFIPGKGYLVSYKDPHPTKTFQGILNNGPVSVDVFSSAGQSPEFGQNLLGNPYPSSIDWKAAAGWNRDNLVTSGGGYEMWIWSEENSNYGAYNSSSSSDEGTLGTGRYIAPNQGFFVKAAQNGTVTMDNAIRVHQGAANWLKSAGIPAFAGKVKLTVESTHGTGKDEVVVEFGHQQNETGTRKKFSFIPAAPSLYISRNQVNYSICLAGDREKNAVLPVSFKPGATGNFRLTAEFAVESFAFLELYDKVTGTRHNLTTEPAYSFQSAASDRTDRFVLQVVPGHYADPHNSLPVNMYSREKSLQIDMRLLSGQFNCEVYTLSGQHVASRILYGGDVARIDVPVSATVVVVHISGNEGKIYKKVPIF